MANVDTITAEKVMNENPEIVSSDQRLSQAKSKMEKMGVRAIPVVSEDDELQGVIGYRDLIRHIQFNPKNTNLSKVMHQPPQFDRDDSLVDLCDLRINSGRKMLVFTEGDKLRGVIGDPEFLEAFNNTDEIENAKTGRLCTRELHLTYEDDSLDEARHMMLDNSISRLPVLDTKNNLTGILHSTDLLRTMISREAPQSGGTSGDRSGNEAYMAGGDEKESLNQVPVSELMQRMVTTTEEHMDGDEAVDLMREQETGEILFVEDNYPEAILTVKDLIEYVKDLRASDTVLVQLIGVDVPEEKAALHEKIRKQLRGSLGRKLDRPEELSVHVKKSEKDGKKHRYEFNVKLHSEYGVTTVKEEGWEMLDVLDEALNELNTQIRKKKEKRDDRRKS